MATIMQMQWQGVTAEQYEATCSRLDWDQLGERGLIAHTAGIHDGSLHVVDVWESAEHFQRFAEETLMPITRELGIGDTEPEMQLFEAIRGWAREGATA